MNRIEFVLTETGISVVTYNNSRGQFKECCASLVSCGTSQQSFTNSRRPVEEHTGRWLDAKATHGSRTRPRPDNSAGNSL